MGQFTSRAGWRAAALCAVVALGCACEGKYHAEAAGVELTSADGVTEAPEGPAIAILPGKPIPTFPDGAVVKVAIAHNVRWDEVRALVDHTEAAGKKLVFLVGQGLKVRAMHLQDAIDDGPAIDIITNLEGKTCVGGPGSVQYKCVERSDRRHVDRAFVRELVREANKTFGLTNVKISLPPGLGWADVVRVVDGARTCCGQTVMRIAISD